MKRLLRAVSVLAALVFPVFAQSGAITGTVALEATGDGVHHATVMIIGLRRTTQTGQRGNYSFQDVPPGNYEVIAHMHPFSDERRKV